MSTLPSAEPAVASPVPASPSVTSRRRRSGWPLLVPALAAAWLLPVVANLLRVDWLLLPVAVIATATLVRGGRTALDRLVLALAFLYAAATVAGLLFSVWPWGLNPLPVAGAGFTVLVLVAAVTGRRPSLPRRADPGDLAVLGGTGIVAAVTLYPLLHRDLAWRLGTFIHVVDFSRHLMMYDTIRLSGGYMFLHRSTALPLVGNAGFLTYPQGAHFVAALTQNFLVSGTAAGPAPQWVGNFIWILAAEYIGMALMVLWGVRQVAGRSGGRWLALPVFALAAGYLAFGDPITIFDRGYLQELPALAALAVLVAVLARPLGRTREQVVLVGLLLAAISFTYYFFLPVAGLLVAIWLVIQRRRLRRVWLFTLVTAVLTLVAAAVIPLANRAASPAVVLLQNGQATPVDRGIVLAFALLAFASAAVLATRGSAVGRFGLLAVTLQVAFVVAIYGYQRMRGGADYFGIKAVHQAIVVVVVLSGAAVYLLRPLARRGAAGLGGSTARVNRGGERPAAAGALLALALAAVTAAPILAFGAEYRYQPGPGQQYLRGLTSHDTLAARTALAIYAADPHPDARTTVVLAGGAWPQYLSTLYAGVLTHRFAPAETFTDSIWPWLGKHPPEQVERLIASSRAPVRVYAADPAILATLRQMAATGPAGHLVVVDLNQIGSH